MQYVYLRILALALALPFMLMPVASEAAVQGPGPEERFTQALSDYDSGLYALASAGARETARLSPGTVWEGRSLFLAGRADAARGELERAADAFGRSKAVYPALTDYADFMLANAYRDAGRSEEAALLYKAVAERSPYGVLAAESMLNACRALCGLGRCEAALPVLDRLIDRQAGRAYTSEALYLRVLAEAATGNADAAFIDYRRLWLDYPESGFTHKAGELALGLATGEKPLPEFDAADHLARAAKLAGLGVYKRAASEYQTAYDMMPEADPGRGDAMLGLGYTSYKTRENINAVSWLSIVAYSGSYPGLAPEALYWIARSYLRTGQEEGFMDAAARCGLEHPGSARAADCLFVLGTEQIFNGEYAGAIDNLGRVTEGYEGADVYPDSLWRLGWAWFMCGEYGKAEPIFRELYERFPETDNAARGMYWRARSLELLGEPDIAGMLYSGLAADFGNSYYGIIATEHAKPILASAPTEAISMPPGLPSPEPGTDEAMLRASELGLLGMREYAVRELKAAEYRYQKNSDAVMRMAVAYNGLDEHRRPMEMAEGLYRPGMRSGRTVIPDDMMRIIFPAAYWDVITREADAFGVDPCLVAALVREESRFDPRAQSPAGAMGLMQLMPETAAAVCRMLGRPGPEGESLKRGEYNLPLGICHLGYLLDKQGGRLVYVLAEYNAGPTPLARWKARMPDAPDDVFVENIGYPETRNYVRRVIRNYGIYRRLYGPNAQQTSDSPPSP